MIKETIIILLIVALIYYYRKSQEQTNFISPKSGGDELTQVKSTNQTLTSFLRNNLNSNSLEELKTKLGEKTLDELIEENEDYETEVDTLTRTKNSLEQDLLTQSNAFQNRLREKDREVERLKKDSKDEKGRADKTQEKLNGEKLINKGNIERISKLTEQITNLEKEKGELEKLKVPESTRITELEQKVKDLERALEEID